MYYTSSFRCPCCNDVLNSEEVERYDEFGGMKKDCYEKSMNAAYEDLPEIFKEGA